MAPVYSNLAVLLNVMSNVGATQTLEEAFATGVLMAKNGGIVCACSPDKHYPATWGPRSSEWRGRVESVLSSRTADAWLPGQKRHRNEPKWYERPPQPRRTKWVEIMPKCANLPHFGTFVCRKRFDPLLHV